jgi:hypothetical protein
LADTRPTPASPWRAARLCLLVLFSPARMEAEEKLDDALRKAMPQAPVQTHRAFVVRRAFFASLALVLTSGAIGYGAGLTVPSLGWCATSRIVAWLQIAGACLLLWGTLFIRGWEIQSYGGVTLTERVNQWVYRSLYCAGTAVIVFSLAFPACKQ